MAWIGAVLDFFSPVEPSHTMIEEPPNVARLHEQVRELMPEELDSDTLEYEEVMVPVDFIWRYGGKSVFLTTSLDGFEKRHRMTPSHGLFMKVMDLPVGRKVLYRYVVDGQLICDREKKHVKNPDDGGNANEIVACDETKGVGSWKNMAPSGMYSWSDSKFGQSIPDQNEFLKNPPDAPPHLGEIPLNRIPEGGSDPLKIPRQSHVHLGHIYVAERDVSEVVVLGITQRFRDKTYTTVYYKHEDSIGRIKRAQSHDAKLNIGGEADSYVLSNYFRTGSYGERLSTLHSKS